jgi:hypothetical protein
MGRIKIALKSFGHRLIQGLDSYVVIIAAIGLGVAAAIGVRLDGYLPGATIALLALISSSLVRINYRIGSASRAPVTVSEILESRDSIDAILNLVNRSSEVWMWGAILTEHIPLLEGVFKQGSARGLKARILLIAPDSPSVGMLAFRAARQPAPVQAQTAAVEYVSSLRETAQYLNRRLEANVSLLERIKRSFSTAGLEYRTVDYLAPYVIYVFDPRSPQGTIMVRLGSQAEENQGRPTLWLSKDKDPDWFDYFRRQFDSGWQAAGLISRGGGWSSADTV